MTSEASEPRARRSGSNLAGDGSVELGLLSTPYLPEIGQRLAEELPRVLSERVSDRVSWEVSVTCDPLAGEPGSTSTQMIDEARERMQQEGYDLVICL